MNPPPPAACSLRIVGAGSAYELGAAAQTGDRVVVAPGTYNENISIRKNVTVIAEGGAGQTVIDGGGRDTVVLFADAQFDGTHSAVLSGVL